MGDDLPDIPLARHSGLGVRVADGAGEHKAVCHYTTLRKDGRSAVREVTEPVLRAQGRWGVSGASGVGIGVQRNL
jgi:3-deoxy-D-manno-octulosonate 8-phosphate phosphatase (KDO 8-P phosphatase)